MTTAKDEGGSFILAPAGTFIAVCVGVYDLGIQKSTFGNKPKVCIRWEIDERIQQVGEYYNKRFCVSKFYTLSLNEKANLTKDLESWRGKKFTAEEIKQGFEVEKVLGQNCFLSIIHAERNGKTSAKIATISPLPKGVEKIKPENNLNEVPEWVKKIQEKAIPQSESYDEEQDLSKYNREESPF